MTVVCVALVSNKRHHSNVLCAVEAVPTLAFMTLRVNSDVRDQLCRWNRALTVRARETVTLCGDYFSHCHAEIPTEATSRKRGLL